MLGSPQGGFTWLDDKTFAWPRTEEGKVVEQAVIETETGKKRVLFNADKLEAAAKKIAGVSSDDAAGFAKQRNWNFSPNKKSVLLTIGNDVYLYAFDSDSMTRLTSSPGEKEEVAFSPDGRFVSFVRDNNIYAVDVASQRERQLTTDGDAQPAERHPRLGLSGGGLRPRQRSARTGGVPTRHASPSCSSTSGRCRRFAVVDHIPYQQNVETEHLSEGGRSESAREALLRRPTGGGAEVKSSTESYSGADFLIVRVDWTPDSSERDVPGPEPRADVARPRCRGRAGGRRAKTLFRETTKAWVDNDRQSPIWLEGRLVPLAQRAQRFQAPVPLRAPTASSSAR